MHPAATQFERWMAGPYPAAQAGPGREVRRSGRDLAPVPFLLATGTGVAAAIVAATSTPTPPDAVRMA